MAAELGTMRVTEQIDALTTLSTDPLRYLVFPRLLAGLLMLPLLVLVADVIGVMGGFLVSVYKLGFAPDRVHQPDLQYLETAGRGLRPRQGRRVRLHRRADGLLSGLPFQGRRPGRRCGHHQGRGHGLDPDPHRQLRRHRAVLQPMSEPAPKIAIRGLTKSFGAKKVLQGVDLDLPAGQSLVVIGGSGTGKSVLIKCVLGLMVARQRLDPHRRRSRWWVPTRATMDELRRKFGMLFQGGALFDSLPVWENVAFGLLATKRRRPRSRRGPRRVARPWAWSGSAPEVADADAGRAVRRDAKARRPRPRHRPRRPRSCSSTSRPPASTRSWPT